MRDTGEVTSGRVMSVMLGLPQVWTIEDLQGMPDDDPHRYEIVDGALVVSPMPGLWHQGVVGSLRRVLFAQLPAPLDCAEYIAVGLGAPTGCRT